MSGAGTRISHMGQCDRCLREPVAVEYFEAEEGTGWLCKRCEHEIWEPRTLD
jgi:hypothetical protein